MGANEKAAATYHPNDGPTPATPAQIEAAAEAARVAYMREYDRQDLWHRVARAALTAAARQQPAGDEHHTMDELYEYRMLYNAHAAQGWLAAGIPVVKSRHHSDGEPCFGGGWFIVTATLPTGQVSNHYRDEHWWLFAVPEVDLPPEYDGHTPAVAATRLLDALAAQPAPEADEREALDPMTREKVAARIWREVFNPADREMWSHKGDVPPEIADLCRDAAERLHHDGLLARCSQPAPRTVTEWGVRSRWTGLDALPCADEAEARRQASIRYDEPGATVIRREVTEWTEAPRG